MRYRTVSRSDGGHEVSAVLDRELLDGWIARSALDFERSIVWLESIEALDFTRVKTVTTANARDGLPEVDEPVIVLGYSTLLDDAPVHPLSKKYIRRVFYLTVDDAQLNMNAFPDDAVDPRTVLPGIEGSAPDLLEIERGYPHYLCRASVV